MRPPQRHTRGLRYPDTLSPPSESTDSSSSSTESDELPIRRVPNGILTTREVQEFSENHPICLRVPFFITRNRRPLPVEDVARKLVGHFLVSREKNLVLQIVETEAYPEHEHIYRNRFPWVPEDFRGSPGRLVSCIVGLGQQHIFITAGADASRDVVLLRACRAVHGEAEIADRVNLVLPSTQCQLRNMMSGPTRVGMALTPELGSPYSLLTPSRGLNLLRRDPGNPLTLLDGPRMLPRDTPRKRYSEMPGANSRFRFAMINDQTLELRRRLRRAVQVNEP